ncbi:competence type IV pilus assembly protein ComGB [Bacillus sp. AK031]
MKSLKDKGLFLRRLGELLTNGYSLTEAIEFLFIGELDGRDASKQRLLFQLQNGSSLSQSLEVLGLPLHVCSQIYFAERHGRMAETLIQAGDYMITRQKDRQALLKVLTYPLVLLTLLIGAITLLKSVLFPQFQTLYSSLGYTPDAAIRIFLRFVEMVPVFVSFLILLCVIISAVFYFRIRSSTPLKKAELYFGIPFLSSYLKLLYTQFFSRELSYLLNSGMSINQALKEVENQSYRPLFKEVAERVSVDLRVGKSFPEALEGFSLFTEGLSEVIRHGERRGHLPHELLMYSQYCMESLEQSGKKVISFIQPGVFLFVGIFILLIYFSIMIPLFQVMQSLG